MSVFVRLDIVCETTSRHRDSYANRRVRNQLSTLQTMSLSTVWIALLLFGRFFSVFVSGDCRMEIWVFQTIEQCEAMAKPENNVYPNAKGFLYTDGQCRTVETATDASTSDYNLLPGTYTAVCTSDGKKIRFIESGCINSDCSSLTVGSDVCQRDQTLEASLYSRLSPPEFNVQDPNNANTPGFYSCSRLVGSDKTVTFTVFGDCSACDTNSNGGDPDPAPVPAPRSIPTDPPRRPTPPPTDPPIEEPQVSPPTRDPITPPTTRRPSRRPTRKPTSSDDVATNAEPTDKPEVTENPTDQPAKDTAPPTKDIDTPTRDTNTPTRETYRPTKTTEPTNEITSLTPTIAPSIEPTPGPTIPVRVDSVVMSMLLSRMNDVMSEDTAMIWSQITASQMANSANVQGYTIGRIVTRNITQALLDTSSQEILVNADPILTLPPRRLQSQDTDLGSSLRVKFVVRVSIPTTTPASVTASRVFDEAFDSENERRQYLVNLRTKNEAFANLTSVQVFEDRPGETTELPTSSPISEIVAGQSLKPVNTGAVVPVEEQTQSRTSRNGNSYGPLIGLLVGAVVFLIVVAIFIHRRKRKDPIGKKVDPNDGQALEQKGSFVAHISSADQRWTNEILVDPQLDDVSTLGGSILAGLNLVEGGPDGEDEPTASVNVDYDFARNQYRTGQNAEEERTLDDVRSRSASDRSSSNPPTMNSTNTFKFGGMAATGNSTIMVGDDDRSFERQFEASQDENDENSNELNNTSNHIGNGGMPQAAIYTSNINAPIILVRNNDSRSGIGSTVFRSSTLALLSKPFEVLAPPGVLGMVIDTPGGTPLVRAIKTTSVLIERVQIGDRLLSVDGEDVRNMSAVQVSSLISQKANFNRSLVFVRPRGAEDGGTANLKASGLYYSNINS